MVWLSDGLGGLVDGSLLGGIEWLRIRTLWQSTNPIIQECTNSSLHYSTTRCAVRPSLPLYFDENWPSLSLNSRLNVVNEP